MTSRSWEPVPLQKGKPRQVAGMDSMDLTSIAHVLWSTKLSICFVCLLCFTSYLQVNLPRSLGQGGYTVLCRSVFFVDGVTKLFFVSLKEKEA